MKQIQPSKNDIQWPRHQVEKLELRKRDLVVRIADWTEQNKRTGEPAYDVEVYIGGIYDFDESKTFSLRNTNKAEAKKLAIAFAQTQIAGLL